MTAWHVDHGLRAGSAEEADVVRVAAERFGAGFESVRVVVEPGPNLEARARTARQSVLPPDAATGHTVDDQAETVLLNLLRGSGLDGLSGMRSGPRHPILGLRRAETHELCAAMSLVPVVDPANDDLIHRRNAIRQEVLPLLASVAGRDVPALLARQARLLADDADLLDALAADIDPSDVAELLRAPLPLARRALRRWLKPGLGGRPPSAAAVERVLAVARGEAVGTEVAEGVRVERKRGTLSTSA